MSASSHWAIAIIVALLTGGLSTLFIRQWLMRRDETAAGIKTLAGTSWRDFSNMLLTALSGRGYTRVVDRESTSGDSDFILEREGARWLLSCKHGSAYVLGRRAVDDLVKDIRLANASGGMLVTQGRILEEARKPAASHDIELLDGPRLWPELRNLIKPEQLAAIRSEAGTRARQRTLFAWLGALVLGIAAFTLLPDPQPAVSASSPARPAVSQQSPSAPAPGVDEASEDQPTVELPPTLQRSAVVESVTALPMVNRALWSSGSTLEVHLDDVQADAIAAICPLIERFPELAASRIQLTPPAGSDARVRFRQCRPY